MKNCLSSVLANNPLEVIVVDNCSTDGTAEFIEENFPQVRLIRSSKNLGYSGGTAYVSNWVKEICDHLDKEMVVDKQT
jgi:GT2 family glycosyltransferase